MSDSEGMTQPRSIGQPARSLPRLPICALALLLAGGCVRQNAAPAAPAAPTVQAAAPAAPADGAAPLLTGHDALGDWTTDRPGVRRKLTVDDLAPPFATPSARNAPREVARPENAWPQAPDGFKVDRLATRMRQPRIVRVAPNGDIFVAESAANQVRLIRDTNHDGKPEYNQVFATGFRRPFGIAFYPSGANPTHVYVANTDSVVRFPYQNGDTQPRGERQFVFGTASGGESLPGGGHWTRDIAFSQDSQTLFVSIGSQSNIGDGPEEARRARIFACDPDGKRERVYASGIRNPVGLAIEPSTGALWTSVNERDGLGDDLVPDYVTSVKEGGFYGWPWFYLGAHQDPRMTAKHAELADKVVVPDVLVQSHSASLAMAFYTGTQFPAEYRGHAFACFHGSWNRDRRTGYKVVQIPLEHGKATGEYLDFLLGFVTPDGNVWGRPVGVATADDGALLVTDDTSHSLWRVSYTGAARQP